MRKLIIVTSDVRPETPGVFDYWYKGLLDELNPRDVVLAADASFVDAREVPPGVRVVHYGADGATRYDDGRAARWRDAHATLEGAVAHAITAWRARGGCAFHVDWFDDDAQSLIDEARAWTHLDATPFESCETQELGDPWPWTFSDDDLVVIDTETAGKVPARHQMLEVAAIRVNASLQVLDEYEARVPLDTTRPFEEGALLVNRYRERVAKGDWATAVSTYDAMTGLVPFLEHAPIAVGHCLSFDLDVVGAALDACGLEHPPLRDRRDTCVMARRMLQRVGKIPNAKLDTVCAHFGVSNSGNHAALVDARRCLEVYRRLIALDKTEAQ